MDDSHKIESDNAYLLKFRFCVCLHCMLDLQSLPLNEVFGNVL